MSADQWKEEGDCTQCRRQKYCTHKCKVGKAREEQEFLRAMSKALRFNKLGEVYERGLQKGLSNGKIR